MTDLIAKLRAALDDDERIARAARAKYFTSKVLGQFSAIGDMRHAIRHDPARVLRQVAAMRKVLDLHQPFIADEDEPDPICQTCTEGSHLYDISAYPCPTLLALAEAYGIEVQT